MSNRKLAERLREMVESHQHKIGYYAIHLHADIEEIADELEAAGSERDAVLEEAARCCEAHIYSPIGEPFMQHCADNIRALKNNAALQVAMQPQSSGKPHLPAESAPPLHPVVQECIDNYGKYYAEQHKLGMSVRSDMIYVAQLALRWADNAAAGSGGQKKLWLWKNFVDGRPEYWAFDNPYPCVVGGGDPQTLGEPCGYAIFKESTRGRTDVSEAEVIAAIKRALAGHCQPAAPAHTDHPLRHWDRTCPACIAEGDTSAEILRLRAALERSVLALETVYQTDIVASVQAQNREALK